MIGRRPPASSKYSSIAKSAAFAFSVSKIVSTMMRSTPPSTSAAGRDLVRVLHLVERHRAIARIVHVGRERERAVHRPQDARDEARLAGRARRERVRYLARDARRGEVHLRDDPLESIVGLRDRRRVEGVGLEDVGAGFEVLRVDLAHDVGTRERQQVVVAAEVLVEVPEPLAAELRFRELVALDHRAHGAVQHEDALLQGIEERGEAGGASRGRLVHENEKTRRHRRTGFWTDRFS